MRFAKGRGLGGGGGDGHAEDKAAPQILLIPRHVHGGNLGSVRVCGGGPVSRRSCVTAEFTVLLCGGGERKQDEEEYEKVEAEVK